MKTIITFLVCACACFVLLQNVAVAQTAEKLYQEGVRLEEVKGNLEQAIEIYKNVVGKFPANQSLAAKSLLHMGRCYEKLGKDEAKKAYERIIKEYASQPDVVTEARARLAVLMDGTKLVGSPIARRLISGSVQPKINNPRTMAPSPDGRWVAYAQAGVYIRNLESGDVKEIAPGQPTANNWWVVWSADGRRLAFPQLDVKTKVGAIKIHDLTSGETVAVPGLDASKLYALDWSHDGRYLLCSHERNTLELVTIKDGTMATLSDSVWMGQRASFSPDSRFVTFARGKYGSESAYTQLIAGGPRHRVADAQGGVYLHPLWSPDGRAIAYQQPSGIWVAPVTNGVASGPGRLAYKTDLPRWPVTWTEAGGFYLTYNAERFQAYKVTVDPTTGEPGNAGAQEIPDAPNDLSSFAWAPDARHITYTGWDSKIRVYAIDTKAMTSYDVGSVQHRPSRSSNGREVLFNTFDPSTRKGLLRALDPVSGQTRDLFPPITGFGFSLSADGQQMVFMRRDAKSGSREVIVAASGHPDGRVVDAGPAVGLGGLPGMSPQGNQVFFVRKGDASPQDGGPNGASLWVVAADGSGARRLASAWRISSAVWDPSGRFLAYDAQPDSGTNARVIRIVEVATGVQRGNVPLPEFRVAYCSVADWSEDGRSIGFFTSSPWWEYWVVQGLQEGVR